MLHVFVPLALRGGNKAVWCESNIVSVLTDCVIIVPVCEYMFVDSGQRVTVSERSVLREYNVHVHTCKCRVTNEKTQVGQ